MMSWLMFAAIGILGSIAAGLFGVGGGMVIGVFVCGLGVYLVYGACERLGWV